MAAYGRSAHHPAVRDVPLPLWYMLTAKPLSHKGRVGTGSPDCNRRVEGKTLVTPEPANSTLLFDFISDSRSFLEKMLVML